MVERFSLDFKNRFFWRIQKKWFLENTFPKATAFGFSLPFNASEKEVAARRDLTREAGTAFPHR